MLSYATTRNKSFLQTILTSHQATEDLQRVASPPHTPSDALASTAMQYQTIFEITSSDRRLTTSSSLPIDDDATVESTSNSLKGILTRGHLSQLKIHLDWRLANSHPTVLFLNDQRVTINIDDGSLDQHLQILDTSINQIRSYIDSIIKPWTTSSRAARLDYNSSFYKTWSPTIS